ncbi:MAG: M13 family metallopeptidase [Thermoanaerobaculia bacterium]|nr:MAG: M13 family metallopeptidase [Thermoanaerobaculia bacterium]
MKRTAPALALLVPVALAAAQTPTTTPDLPPDPVRDSVLSSMDLGADPCQDFYRYACGRWLDATPLPADQARWTRSFSTITEHNREIVKALLEDAAARPGEPGSERQKIGDLYGACMDEAAIEKAGLAPLEPLLAVAGSARDAATLMRAAGELGRADIDVLLGYGAIADFKDPGTALFFMSQGGLGLPDRDYYVSEDPKKKELLAEYERHVARLLGLAGQDAESAGADARRVVAFETELARASRPRAEMRDRDKLYHKIDREGLEKLAPSLPWAAFFEALGAPGIRSINVAVPEFYQALDRLVGASPPETLRAYLRWHVVNQSADFLPERFAVADFEFFGRALSGQAEIQPRWKRCVAAVNGLLGEAVGKLYVEREFAGDSKKVAVEMIEDVERAFEANLAGLAWMDDATRTRAVEKARKVRNKIGYPDAWRDYSAVVVRRDDYFGGAASAARFETARQLAKVGKPVDRGEWLMVPQAVNAYYLSTNNEIVFPAGILQPPFFDEQFPAAMNYGGVGAVMGHELTHGFDDQGRKSDGDGVLREWWEPEVTARFESAARCVEEQYAKLEVEPGVKVDGKLTLGENIADLGGLEQAYDAYKSWEARHGAPAPRVPGLTNDQLLFVSFAQVWCTQTTPEFLRRQVTTDSHSPGQFRAIGAPRNSAAFRRAFSCAPGDRMVAEPTCAVW